MGIPNYQYEPLTPPSSWNADEKRLLQRITDIFDDIYMKYGRLDSNHLAPGAVKDKNVAPGISAEKLAHLDVKVLEAVRARIQELAVDLLSTVELQARFANIGYGDIKDLVADEAIITDGIAGQLHIARLTVTQANMLNATIMRLVMPGPDDKYYAVVVGSDGVLHTEEVTVTEGEVTAGQTSDGRQIVATTINAESINGSTVNAQSAIINTVLTTALTAGQITVAEAFLASATVPQLYTTAVNAIGKVMTFQAQNFEFWAGEIDKMRKAVNITNDGIFIRQPAWVDGEGVEHPASIWHIILSNTGFQIKRDDLAVPVGSFERDRTVTEAVQLGDIVARKTGTGGWVWTDA